MASSKVTQAITDILTEEGRLLTDTDRARLVEEIKNELLGLGPLEPLLWDDDISDILVNGPAQVYVERGGKLYLTDVRFNDDQHLMLIIDRIVSQVGRRVDEASPMVDARLADGSRINAIIPPLALDGPTLSIRRFGKKRYTVDDVLSSRIICKPLHLLDCCVETDNATAIIVTRAERAKDMRHTPALIRGIVGRCSKPRMDMHYQHGPISRVAGYYAKDILWPNSGVGPEDIDAVGAYDAFTFTSMLQLEDYGFCKKGEGGEYVSSGITRLGGRRPQNTSGGHLCEGYTHGMNMVIENVRQLRHDVDDSCPVGPDGKHQHTYDYREGGCRQVKNVEVTANLGWANPMTGSAMVMRRGA